MRALLAAGARVAALVTAGTKLRSRISDYVDLRPLCESNGVAVIETDDINDPPTIAAIAEYAPDFLFTLGWSQLFGEELLRVPSRFVVGSHPTALPLGRGRAPIPWTILEAIERSAVSLFRMLPGVDSGPLLRQRWFDVPRRAYARELYAITAQEQATAFVDLLQTIRAGNIVETPQDEAAATHYAKRAPIHGWLDFSRPALEIERLIRAVSRPYPGAYAYHNGRRIIIWRADADNVPRYRGTAGQILTKRDGRLLVQAGDRPIWLFDLSDDGGSVSSAEFITGSQFGYVVQDELHRIRAALAQLQAGKTE